MAPFRNDDPLDGPKLDVEQFEQQNDTDAALKALDGVNADQAAMFRQFVLADAEWHQGMQKKLMRKVDLHLLPLLIMMYLLNFLDRKLVFLPAV